MATGNYSGFPIPWNDSLAAFGIAGLATANSFTAAQRFAGDIGGWVATPGGVRVGTAGTIPQIRYTYAEGGANSKNWDTYANDTGYVCRAINDAGDSAVTWLNVTRSGMSVPTVVFPSSSVGIGVAPTLATLQVSGNIRGTSPGGGTGTSLVTVGGSSNFQVTHTAASTRVKLINSAGAGADMSIGGSGGENIVVESSGGVTLSHGLKLAQYTLATLPSAAAFSGYVIDVTNATGGPKICRSNGTVWQILNTTTTVS